MAALLPVFGIQGYVIAVNTGAAPMLAADFGLDDAGVARVFGWHATGALGALILARYADRLGRRRMLLMSAVGVMISSLATAVAPDLLGFVLAQIAKEAFAGALLAAGTVVIAEELPIGSRAPGQSWGGILLAVGGGLALLVVALVAELPGSWRWAWVFSGAALIGLLPFLRAALPETARFRRADEREEARRARMRELFGGVYRRRSAGVLINWFLAQLTYTVTHSWLIYHPQRTLGIEPMVITAVVIGAGALGLVGNPLGALLADRLGRRPTMLLGGSATTVASVAFYWVPAESAIPPALLLAGLFLATTVFDAARTVVYRSSTTELFPTRLRSTLQGAAMLVGALSAVFAQFATALLSEMLGGLVPAITVLGLAGLPACWIFFRAIPETAGVELESAALEAD